MVGQMDDSKAESMDNWRAALMDSDTVEMKVEQSVAVTGSLKAEMSAAGMVGTSADPLVF